MKTVTTKGDIVRGLRELGLKTGDKVLVHSSLSSFGHVEGGAEAVIDALLDAVGAADFVGGGTVLVPTLTGSEQLTPQNPPTFDPEKTPCWTGRIPETFRKRPEASRSLHPTHSVAAIGADAEALTAGHINSITPCDERSPYGELAAREDGYILLIGVDHRANTTMHHVEEMAGVDYHMQAGFAAARITVNGQIITRHVLLHRYGQPRDFNRMQPVYLERGIQRNTTIGASTVRLVRAREMVRVTLRALLADSGVLCKQ